MSTPTEAQQQPETADAAPEPALVSELVQWLVDVASSVAMPGAGHEHTDDAGKHY